MVFRRKDKDRQGQGFEPLTRIEAGDHGRPEPSGFRDRYRDGSPQAPPSGTQPVQRSTSGVSPEPPTRVASFGESERQRPSVQTPSERPPEAQKQNVQITPPSVQPSAEPQTRLFGVGSLGAGPADIPAQGVPTSQIPPAGWLVITNGPGRGNFTAIGYGMNGIGRAPGQRIQLNYGDPHISRENHAYVVYDGKHRRFFVSHGGGDNLTYVNGELVLGDKKELKDRDVISIGDTDLLLVTLCSEQFDWNMQDTSGG